MDEQETWADPWWTPVDEGTAAQWARNLRTGETRCVGLVMYGAITATRLRALRVGDLDPEAHYKLTGATPPAELVRMTYEHSEADKLAAAHGTRERVYSFPPRAPGETADSFYARLALLMSDLRQHYPSAPVKKLSDVMDVPFSTAVYWNNELKKREGTK